LPGNRSQLPKILSWERKFGKKFGRKKYMEESADIWGSIGD